MFYYKEYITTFFDFAYISIEIFLLYWLLLYKSTSEVFSLYKSTSKVFPTSNTNKVNITPVKLTNSKKMKMYNLIDY